MQKAKKQIKQKIAELTKKYTKEGSDDYGPAYHRVIQGVLEGIISVNKDGILDEDSVKSFLEKLATSTGKTKKKDREAVKGIVDIDKQTKELV